MPPLATRLTLTLLALSVSACAAAVPPFPSGQVIDLSHAFDEDTIYWPTADGFHLETVFEGETEAGFFYAANNLCTAEHGGTHLDAPIHFHRDRMTLDEIPPSQLMGPGALIDVSAACAGDRDYLVTVADIEAWESANGRLPDGAIVLLRTGFEAFWPDRSRYMGTDERGPGAVAKLHFPGLHPETARWLAAERSIGAVGLDTPSIDHGPSTLFESHVALFAENVPAIENVANLDRLPASGFSVIALPMKIRGGSGGPVRVVAIVP